MNLIISLLIAFFAMIFLVKLQEWMTTRATPSPYLEGMTDTSGATSADTTTTYQDYSPNNALILSQQNAGNIQFLKTRVDNLDAANAKFNQYVFDMSNNLTSLNDQVNTIIEQQAQYAQAVAPEPVSTSSMDLSMPDGSSSSTGATTDTGTSTTT